MRRVFVGNFEFEHELAAPARALHDTGIRRGVEIASGLSGLWNAVAEPKDVIFTDSLGFVPSSLPSFAPAEIPCEKLEIVPWGWTESVVQLAQQFGWQAVHPELEVVRRVNRRSYRFQLEQELGIALHGSRLIEEAESADSAIGNLLQQHGSEARWVLKAEFGMAGREQWRGQGEMRGTPCAGWLRRRLAVGPVVIEPWVESIDEAGIQIDIPREGLPVLLGVTPQLVRAGAYWGSRVGAAEDVRPWEPAVPTALAVAQRMQSAGYFGPVGVDAMRYRTSTGEVRLRPLQDLNARYTMGRLALGLLRWLREGECAAWLLGSWTVKRTDFSAALARILESAPAGCRIIELSPDHDDPRRGGRCSAVLIAPSTSARDEIETLWHSLFESRPHSPP